MPRRKVATPVATTTYLIVHDNGDAVQFTVPSTYKVTFGPLTPGSVSTYGKGEVLRFYEADNKQRAIFRNVAYFRDTSLHIQSVSLTPAITTTPTHIKGTNKIIRGSSTYPVVTVVSGATIGSFATTAEEEEDRTSTPF